MMNYDIVKYVLDLNDSMLYYVKVYDDECETKEQARKRLAEIIKQEKEEQDGEYYGIIPFYAISDLPSLSRNNGIIKMSFYASDNLDDALMDKFDAYTKAHHMDYELIKNN